MTSALSFADWMGAVQEQMELALLRHLPVAGSVPAD